MKIVTVRAHIFENTVRLIDLTDQLKISGIDPEMHKNTGEIAEQNNRHPAHVVPEGVAMLDSAEQSDARRGANCQQATADTEGQGQLQLLTLKKIGVHVQYRKH